jgi:hypothetical protein
VDELHFIQHPHDALFRAVFGDPDNAAELLRSVLPAAITAAIDWRSLRRVEGSFVDEALRDKHADLLFCADINGKRTLVYLLNEHKSEEDPWTSFQMLRYAVAIWERYRREHPDELALPPILPVVLHHGTKPWRGPRDLRSLISLDGLPTEIAAMQPDFEFQLDDLSALDDQALQARRMSVRALLPMLHLQCMRKNPDTGALLLSWRALYRRLLVTPGGRSIAHLLVSYTAAVSNDEPERLRRAFRQIEPAMETDYMTTAEQLIQRGLERGLQQGAAQGANLLLTILEQRFGPLSDAAVQRVRGSSAQQLEQIALAILTAPTLDEVLPD